jgi:hypothetical protein
MSEANGRWIALSPARRFICDLLHHARQVPTVPVQRRLRLRPLLRARRRAAPRPSLSVLFTKAYGIVAARHPELRRAYLTFPRPRLYEHPHSVASIAIERQVGGENVVLFAHLRAPEKQPLDKLDATLRRYRTEPVESVGLFRRIGVLNRLPGPLRRLAWWGLLNCSGFRRARQFGTFGVTVYSALGCESLHPLSPLTTTLTYGVLDRRGALDVRLIYDHRVTDGATVARALAELENVLNGELVAELQELEVFGGRPELFEGPGTEAHADGVDESSESAPFPDSLGE